jgi:hypothetical protein
VILQASWIIPEKGILDLLEAAQVVLGARWKIRWRGGIKRGGRPIEHQDAWISLEQTNTLSHPRISEGHFSQNLHFCPLFRPFPCPTSGF